MNRMQPKRSRFRKVILTISLLIIISFVGLIIWVIMYPPCSSPLQYTIGNIDKRFGISKEKIIREAKEAVSVWENLRHTDLFEFTDDLKTKPLIINFVYDDRQQSLETGQNIDKEFEKYDKAVSLYEKSSQAYKDRLLKYENKADQYEKDLKIYEATFDKWEADGKNEDDVLKWIRTEDARLDGIYSSLQTESEAIDKIYYALEDERAALENIRESNQKISDDFYKEHEEDVERGTYDSDTNTITIYEYKGDRDLKWLLTHEFGHALGLNHVDEPGSVMYWHSGYTPQVSLSNSDAIEFARVCVAY